jgi:uncharacterized repeat protein (TIGR01451 family)
MYQTPNSPGRHGRGRILRRLALIPAMIAASFFVVASPALAANQTISSAGPLSAVIISDVLNCQVTHTSDTSFEFYDPIDPVGACGTLVAVGGTLYGPDVLPAGGDANPRTTYTPVSQSAVTGSGSVADPYRIVTVVDAGTSGLRLTETDSYVVGQESYRTDVQLANSGSAALDAIVYRAGDCYLQNSDEGYGAVNTTTGAVSCVASAPGGGPGDRIEQWFPLTPGSRYFEDDYDDVWAQIGSQTVFPNTCTCDSNLDNGAGLSWSLSIAAGTSATVSHFTTFAPLGQDPLTTTKAANAPTSAPGAVNGYTIHISNPNAGSITISAITDLLPAGFAFVAGSSSGVTTSDPTVSAQTLTWSGPFNLAAASTLTLQFAVTVSTTPGTYLNDATGTAEGVAVTGTGPTAPITVTAAATPTPIPTAIPTAIPAATLLPDAGMAGSTGAGGSPAILLFSLMLIGSLSVLLFINLRTARARNR